VVRRVRRGGGKACLLPHALRLQAALNSPSAMALRREGKEARARFFG
jgi:hypothetical protein